MVATGETMGLAEWIIDDSCLVKFSSKYFWSMMLAVTQYIYANLIFFDLLFASFYYRNTLKELKIG